MSCKMLTVVWRSSGWFVDHEKSSQGPYRSDDLAVRVAVIEALAHRRGGVRSQVSVQDTNGRIRAEYPL
jgi:hypothetical protein